MIVGFTGSQKGMSSFQLHRLEHLLEELKPTQVHHGDCIGADEMLHSKVRRMFPEAVIHVHPAMMTRNQAIVDSCELLIATPARVESSSPYSGTWTTIRRARKAGKEVVIIWMDGRTEGDYDSFIDE